MLASILSAGVIAQAAVVEAPEIVRFGSIEGAPPTVFGRIVDLAANAEEQVFVLDALASEVRVFSGVGEHLVTFGRAGPGPGELNRPVSISWSSGEVLVQNSGGLASRFSETGDFIEASQFGFGAEATSRLRNGSVALRRSGSISLRRSDPVESLVLIRADGTDTIQTAPSTDLFVRNEVGAGAFRSPFCGLVHHGVTPSQELVVADGLSGEVRVYDVSGAEVRLIAEKRVTGPASPLTDADHDLLLDRVPEQFSATREHLETAGVRASLCGLEIGADGRVWVRIADREDREVWVAHDSDLQQLATVLAPAGVEIMAISIRTAFGVIRDELGFQYVVVIEMPEADDF